MAVPTFVSQTTFAAESGGNSSRIALNATPTRRFISVTIPEAPGGFYPQIAGWGWIEVENSLSSWIRVETRLVIIGVETGLVLPSEYQALAWRVIFIPAPWLSPRTGVMRVYTI